MEGFMQQQNFQERTTKFNWCLELLMWVSQSMIMNNTNTTVTPNIIFLIRCLRQCYIPIPILPVYTIEKSFKLLHKNWQSR